MSDDDIRDNQILDLQDIVNNLKERISELEKELTTHRGAEVNTSNYLSGEIAELREKGKNHNDSIIELRSLIQSNAISDLNHYDVNQNQLNELKEQIKSQSKFWHILSEDMVIQRKVLREFVDEVGVNCYRTEFSGITDKEKTENAILYKKYLLEKLDGVGSASARESLDRQTEKKESDFTDEAMNNIYNHLNDKELYNLEYPKASGGENSQDSSMEGGESIHIATPNDSKLLEPKWYPGVKEVEVFYEDRLPGGTDTEPREDDCGEHEYTLSKTCIYCGHWESLSPLYDIVKREDLQFLFDNTTPEGIFDDDCLDEFEVEKKRIKEEYQIE